MFKRLREVTHLVNNLKKLGLSIEIND